MSEAAEEARRKWHEMLALPPGDRKARHDQAMVGALRKVLFGPGVSSFNRLDVFLALTRPVRYDVKPAAVFWSVFWDTWPCCDGTFRLNDELLDRCRFYTHSGLPELGCDPARGVNFLPENDLAFLDALPDPVPVFRGCSRQHVNSICWTADRDIAAKFAGGIRIRVPSPVIASGFIAKENVFGVATSRKESDVLLDPRDLYYGVKVQALKSTRRQSKRATPAY